jgi:hypothetical protein
VVGDLTEGVEGFVMSPQAVVVLPGPSRRSGHEDDDDQDSGNEESQAHKCIRLLMVSMGDAR